MIMFYQENPPNPPKRFKCLASSLKDAFSKCHSFQDKLSVASPESEELVTDFDEEEEIFVSAIISKYVESKSKRKSAIGMDSFKWALSPDRAEFYSADSRLSRCSSAMSFDEFVSVKTRCSRSSSLNKIDFLDFGRRSVILEFIHCEGWPFGLCRKALLLPPLPKSPSDSWSWRKSGKMIKVHG
ncbi:hypothetical protein BUALT_Bualt08G0053800 [Buddleja alternifolia]|uniref:Uncharacterized protein n=1 Tax=Buddleja alternifolia TaxID=168488 RepID=A0AAV6X5C6_9LAMI|nr:hypothetical protein BUALT_Bualt08G0053800 [Buddleja alternifolia]